MEKWKEVFVGIIPQGTYEIQVTNGEERGLILEFKGKDNCIALTFGVVRAVRMLDEGIVQTELYADCEIKKFKKDNFRNVIYEVKGGEFERQIQRIAGGYWEALDVKHYIIITQNFNIEIITEWEPEIYNLNT